MNRLRRQIQRQSWLRQLPIAIGVAVMILAASRITLAQTINIDRVVAELEPEIQRTLLEFKLADRAMDLLKKRTYQEVRQ